MADANTHVSESSFLKLSKIKYAQANKSYFFSKHEGNVQVLPPSGSLRHRAHLV